MSRQFVHDESLGEPSQKPEEREKANETIQIKNKKCERLRIIP